MEFSELKIRIDGENSSQAPRFASSMSALHQTLTIQGLSFNQIVRQLQEQRKNLYQWHFSGNDELHFKGITNIIIDFYTRNIDVYRSKDLQYLVSEEKKRIEAEKQALRGWLNQLLQQNGIENKSVYFQMWERDLDSSFHNWMIEIRELCVEFENQRKKFLEMKSKEDKKLELLERQTIALELNAKENLFKKLYFTGGFWIMVLLVVLFIVKTVVDMQLSWYLFPIVILSIPLIFSILGGFILRTMENLSEESFLKLMKMSFSFGLNAMKDGKSSVDAEN